MDVTGNRALIVGGGIGGLAAAVALRRVGVEARVVERAPELREVGAALSLWSNAVKALRRLGVDEAVVAQGTVVERAVTMAADGRVLSEAAMGQLSQEAGAPSVCVHRADLQRTLADAVGPDCIQLDATCVGIEHDGDGAAAILSDGRRVSGEVLIGADGIRSVVRARLLGDEEPRYSGYVAFRGIASIEHPYLPPGQTRFILGRGTQVGLFPCGPGRVYWFATVNAPKPGSSPSRSAKEEVCDAVRGWTAVVPEIVAATEDGDLLRGDVIDRPPAWPWGRGRVTLLGDAIHPTTPNLGQGACQALESAVVLARCVQERGLGPEALRAYEAARRERAAMVTKQSWSLGAVFQWERPLAVWLRTRLLRSRLADRRSARLLAELLHYDPPELTPAAAASP